jgi:CRISPR/Cas system CSM-associated protein Csm3 (group 7 of RAMP superfamily)
MHKRLLNEATLDFTIVPEGPILVKAGETGADPTRPDMEFVRTWRNGQRVVYLPGPSLKGVIRSHCERIVRTVGRDGSCCNPVVKEESCVGRYDLKQEHDGVYVHKHSCFICQMFGNTVLGGRVRTADAYPPTVEEYERGHPDVKEEWDREGLSHEERWIRIEPRTEERNGVAIDRVFGSVAVGPFQMEVVTSGEFKTKIAIRNFTIAQLGLLALALRDLRLGRVGVGFGKSRGLGHVTADFDQLTIRYMRYPRKLIPDSKKPEKLVGVARLLAKEDAENEEEAIRVVKKYGYRTGKDAAFGYTSVDQDVSDGLPDNLKLEENNWGEWTLTVVGERIEDVWKACIPAWKAAIRLEGGV